MSYQDLSDNQQGESKSPSPVRKEQTFESRKQEEAPASLNLARIKALIESRKQAKITIEKQQYQQLHLEQEEERQEEPEAVLLNSEGQLKVLQGIEEAETRRRKEPSDYLAAAKLVCSPVAPGLKVSALVVRNVEGMNRVLPQYDMYTEDGFKYMLSAKKRLGKTSNFAFSVDKEEVAAYGPAYVAKLRANFLGTEFNLYDTGSNFQNEKLYDTARVNLMTAIYEENFVVKRGPRKVEVYLPPANRVEQFKQLLPEWNLKVERQRGNELVQPFFNRAPILDEQTNSWYVDFGGRIESPSVKNFILQNSEGAEVLMFGRSGQNVFKLEVRHPFSLLQGFALAVSSLDGKLACK